LPAPTENGTPGEQNSRYQANVGPTYADLRHGPVVPAAGEAVTVSVAAADPQGVAAMTLWYSVDGGAFAEPGARDDSISRLSERAVTEDGWVKIMKPVVDPIRDALANASTLAAFREQLDAIEPDTTALKDRLAESMFAARVAGEVEADIGDGAGGK